MFKNLSIKAKLVIIFILFKVIPLLFLAGIAIVSFKEIDTLLKRSSSDIIQSSQHAIEKTTNTALSESIKALDAKSQSNLEHKTVIIADQIARFLRERDEDIRFLSRMVIKQRSLKAFYEQKRRGIYLPAAYRYDEANDRWVPQQQSRHNQVITHTTLSDNTNAFHKVQKSERAKKIIPIYKEVTFYKPNGQELYKISTIDKTLKNISIRKNTYLHAETYFQEAKKLKKGEIYVSKVIGAYVPSPVIGAFTKAKAAKAGIDFAPQNYAYAGKENPLGKKFEGIIRFVTPIYEKKKLKGYLTLALDHRHIMDFTDYFNPLAPETLDIPDASNGNYAFLWDRDFLCISHPRDYFIVGYDPKTGKRVPGWIDAAMAKKFKESNESDLNAFLQKQPIFFEQSLKKKPNIEQIKKGELGLDCKYLNFAPQCEGWSELVKDGGYGSFVIYWSKIWKLTTAASIPYYTGQYGKSKIGFGFVTIGANVAKFHSAATQTKKEIDAIFEKENSSIQKSISSISDAIYKEIHTQISQISLVTLLLTLLVIYIAIRIADNISERIKKVLIGTQRLKERDFEYKIETDSHDELDELALSFNEMAEAIQKLNKGLERQLYTDELTGLHNRKALERELSAVNEAKTLFVIDIDSFKTINDYYGSEAGNFILKEFSLALKRFIESYKMDLYRIGSDEFALLKHRACTHEEIKEIVTRLNEYFASLHFSNNTLHLDTTISFACGIAVAEENLIASADLALNEAKENKKLFTIYDPDDPTMNRHSEYILWRQKIEYAIKHDNIVPFYQQIVDINNPHHVKYESLLRMIDDEKVISPYLFLDIAKESKLYPQLTKIMIEKSFRTFQDTGIDFSLNLSIEDIQNPETVSYLFQALEQYKVDKQLIIEIIETEEIENFEKVIPFIEEMRARHVRFAIDDFGSGYSNFSYLLKVKPEFLKIDGTLIKNIHAKSTEYHIVDAIVKIAQSLDAKLIAEHVSSRETLELLKAFGIDFIQGYYFSEPLRDIEKPERRV